MHSNPGSLVTVRTLAPLVMLVTGIVTILQGSLVESGLFPVVLFGLGVPTLGTTAVAWMLARQRYVGALLAVVGWAGAHLLLGFVVALFQNHSGDEITLGAVASVITFVLAIPGWAVCAWFSRRRELDAGDTLLGWAAVWFGALQCLYIRMLEGKAEAVASAWVVLGGCVIILGVAIWRGASRRALAARAGRGEDAAWRVREPSIDELAHLPPLFANREYPGVLERVRVASPSSAYRSEQVGEPFALVPLPAR